MEAAFWHERWQNQQIGFHQAQINADLLACWPSLGANSNCPVFVPLCGKSRDMLWLVQQGHSVIGVELSAHAVAAFFAENNLIAQTETCGAFTRWRTPTGDITLYQGDFFSLTPDMLQSIGAIYDRAALIALPPPMRAAYVRHWQRILPATAPALLLAMEYPQGGREPPPFALNEDDVQDLFSPSYRVECLQRRNTLAAPENARWRTLGVPWLFEAVYALRPCLLQTIR